MEGRSILPLLRDEAADWPAEVFLQISESQVARSIRTHRWKYCVNAPDRLGWRVARSDHYVEEALYDLEADPYELENIVGVDAFRGVADELRARSLRGWWLPANRNR